MYLDKILHQRRASDRYPASAEQVTAWMKMVAAAEPPRGFAQALREASFPTVISEFKRASPSKGVLNADMDPVEQARRYEAGGASALSVLTEPHHFRGSLVDLQRARAAVSLPVLRKDFLLQPWELFEARAHDADAVLLIAAALERETLAEMLTLTHSLGMDALVEVHDQAELDWVLEVEPRIVGINNRNLKTFEVDLETTSRLAERVPEGVLTVSESGFESQSQLLRFRNRVDAFLIGESLVTSGDPEGALRRLRDV